MFERLWFSSDRFPKGVYYHFEAGKRLCDFDVLKKLKTAWYCKNKKLQAFRFELQNLINHSLLTGGKITQMFCF